MCDMQPSFEDQKLNYGLEMLEALFAVWIRANSPQQAGPQTPPDPQQSPDTDNGYKLLLSSVATIACTCCAYALMIFRGIFKSACLVSHTRIAARLLSPPIF